MSSGTANTETQFYDRPVWYDLLHEKGTAWEVGFLRRLADRWLTTGADGDVPDPSNQTWLEPACGTARYLRHLATRGYNVVGYDINERMLQYARRRLMRASLNARLFLADMTEFCKPRTFDVAFNMINTFRHLMSEKDAQRHLRLIAKSLKPGGIYVLGLDVVDYAKPEPLEETWKAKKAGCNLTHVMMAVPPDPKTRRERIINHITIKTRKREYYYESTYDLFAYDIDQWKRVLDRSPFEVVEAYDFSHQPIRITRKSRDMNLVLQVKA